MCDPCLAEHLEPAARAAAATASAAASTAAAAAVEHAPRAREHLTRLTTRAVDLATVAAERASEAEQQLAGRLGLLIVGADEEDVLLAAAEVPSPPIYCRSCTSASHHGSLACACSAARCAGLRRSRAHETCAPIQESIPVSPELVTFVDSLSLDSFRSAARGAPPAPLRVRGAFAVG